MQRPAPLLALALLAGCATRAPAPVAAGPKADTSSAAKLVKELPLQRGYFVDESTPCADASNATLSLYTGHGINVARAFCAFTRIEKTGAHTYSATQTCDLISAPSESSEIVFTIDDARAYSAHDVTNERRYGARYCPQASLPEPWRSNELSDLLK